MSTAVVSIALPLVLLASASPEAYANRRSFANTYDYSTTPAGDVELEVHNLQERTTFGGDALASYQNQFELEFGITSHWDMAIYQVLEETVDPAGVGSEPLHFAETKLETRYRFGERGSSPIDTLLYLEVAKRFGETAWDIEPKLVLSRDFGPLRVVGNLIGEIQLAHEDPGLGQKEFDSKAEAGWSVGAGYEVSPKWILGAETFGAVEDVGGDNELEAWAGPSVSWAPSSKIWLASTAGFGLGDDSSAFQFRLILGVGL